MLALIYRDGVVEEAPRDLAHLPCIRQRGERKRALVRTRLTRAERRFVARLASGPGRRRARPVTRPVMRLEWVEQIERLDAHHIAGPTAPGAPPWIRSVEVRLFLPAGARAERQHLDAVERWLEHLWPWGWYERSAANGVPPAAGATRRS